MKAKDLLALVESLYAPSYQVSNVAKDLDELGIEYCIIGGIALGVHNYLRYTEDIDILVSKSSASKIQELIGHGYTLRPGSNKNLTYTIGPKRIPIDILVEGDIEGDVSLPNPVNVRVKLFGVWYLDLPSLIEFKLNAGRDKDISDVRELIKANSLDQSFSTGLNSSVRSKFLSLL